MKSKINTLRDVYEKLVVPVCALESLSNMNLDDPSEKEPLYECVAGTLRNILNEIELSM